MPRILNRSRANSDDDSDESPSQRVRPSGSQSVRSTQSGASTPGRGGGALNQDDIDKMVSDVVFYLLVADQKKQLIKRAELCKNCDLTRKSRGDQDNVIEKAKVHLSTIFGIKVEELEHKKGHYILVNQLTESNDTDTQHLHWGDAECGQMGLTFSILGLIFMSGGKVSDDILFKFLKNLGVYEEEAGRRDRARDRDAVDPEVAALFGGDVKKFVNEVLVGKQHYLARVRVPQNDVEVEVYEYTWGERAEAEVRRSSVLKVVCELYENCSPRMFKEQFDKVKELEGEDAMEDDTESETS